MDALPSDAAVAERVLAHIANRTTDRGDEVWREPVANYRLPARFAAELGLMRRFPTAFCPAAALPNPGDYVARDAAGVPILAVRGTDGRVRAFRNACRHRGMQLVRGAGCSRAFVCRYHGWTYALDGALRHIPHESGFPGVERAAHGLVPVTATESHGTIFITQEAPAVADDSLAALPKLLTPEQRLFESREDEIPANWKLLLEGFIEGYHIRSTHPQTFLPYGFDNLNVIDVFGRGCRVTYPFQRIKKLEAVPPAERRVEGLLTYAYHLFPNVVVTVLSRHTNLIVLEPLTEDRTRMVRYALTHGEGEEALAEAKRDQEFVINGGITEDREVVMAIQRSIGSGANEVFTFGAFESAIVHFHRTLTALLETSARPRLAQAQITSAASGSA
jgi:phenylpropionate dioxygenase-like ring-hydroxylating dioxygenase large terminal subunit